MDKQPKRIEEMTADELRRALADYAREQQPVDQEPLPPGVSADLPQNVRDEAARFYAQAIEAKPPHMWTPDEKAFMVKAVAATLRKLGY